MSSLKLFNPNSGSLKLEYDSRPRDLATEKIINEIPLHQRDFRYHGYPEESFFRAKKSNKRPISEEDKIKKRLSGVKNLYNPQKQMEMKDEFALNLDLDESSLEQPGQQEERRNVPVMFENQDTAVNDNFMAKSAYEIEKLKREKKEAQEDIAMFKAEQQRKVKESQEEKRREYERSTNYYIWDSKASGHGAPKGDGDHRKQKFTEEELAAKDLTKYKETLPRRSDLFSEDAGKLHGGSGAPLQTDSGSPQTRFRLHPSIHFQDKENVPPALLERLQATQSGNKRGQYGKELLKQSQEQEMMNQEEKIQELKREIEMLKGNDPYGKPGAGAPNVSKSDSFTERKENKYLEVEEKPQTYPSPRRRLAHYDENAEPYFPYGRPGAGAPIIDIDGNVITSFKNKLERNTSSAEERRKVRAARVYYNELKKEEHEHRKIRQEFDDHLKAPMSEFASLIKEGQVGKPRRDPITGILLNQHLPSSDISKFKMNTQYKGPEEMRMYHEDLSKQADDRHRIRELNRLKDKQMSKQHYDVMDEYWGKFGGGAPKDPFIRKKAVLDHTLYSPGRPVEYHKTTELHESPPEKVLPKYSTHKTNYDYTDNSKKEYRYGPPYATSG